MHPDTTSFSYHLTIQYATPINYSAALARLFASPRGAAAATHILALLGTSHSTFADEFRSTLESFLRSEFALAKLSPPSQDSLT